MRRFEAYPDRAKSLGLGFLSLLLVGMSAYCVAQPELMAKVAGAAGVIFFTACCFGWARKWLHPHHPQIVFDEHGISTGTPAGLVDWSDVVGFSIDSIKTTKFLSIHVDNVEKYLARMTPSAEHFARLNPQFGVSEIAITFVGLTPGLDEACYYLREYGFEIRGY